MKQVHRLKEANRKLDNALRKIYGIAERDKKSGHMLIIREIVEEALDKKGNHK